MIAHQIFSDHFIIQTYSTWSTVNHQSKITAETATALSFLSFLRRQYDRSERQPHTCKQTGACGLICRVVKSDRLPWMQIPMQLTRLVVSGC